MESNDIDKLLNEILKQAELENATTDLVTIMFCVILLSKTKHDKVLYAAANKKVFDTIKDLDIYKSYISKLKKEN